MKCSKCGREIKNLPDYLIDTGAELLCTECAGTSERTSDSPYTYSGLRSYKVYHDSEDDVEIAA